MKYSGEKRQAVWAVIALYLLCFALRLGELFWLRTDRTIWGEAFLHKIAGIGILLLAARLLSVENLGFRSPKRALRSAQGLGLGLAVFVLAYGAELLVLAGQGEQPSLAVYVSAYGVNGNLGNQTAPLFFLLCLAGNLINVVMEEGLFRGLFQQLLERRFSFVAAAAGCSVLFGLWHIAAPLREWWEGSAGLGAALMQAALLALLSALVGFKLALLSRMGGLYLAMGDHFCNNTLSNLLHVLSAGQADQLMSLRIALAQVLSFCLVLALYRRWRNRQAGRAAVPLT